jgi:hypothetical protein
LLHFDSAQRQDSDRPSNFEVYLPENREIPLNSKIEIDLVSAQIPNIAYNLKNEKVAIYTYDQSAWRTFTKVLNGNYDITTQEDLDAMTRFTYTSGGSGTYNTGTLTESSATPTTSVAITFSSAHSFSVGTLVYCDFTSGGLPDGQYTILETNTNSILISLPQQYLANGSVTVYRVKYHLGLDYRSGKFYGAKGGSGDGGDIYVFASTKFGALAYGIPISTPDTSTWNTGAIDLLKTYPYGYKLIRNDKVDDLSWLANDSYENWKNEFYMPNTIMLTVPYIQVRLDEEFFIDCYEHEKNEKGQSLAQSSNILASVNFAGDYGTFTTYKNDTNLAVYSERRDCQTFRIILTDMFGDEFTQIPAWSGILRVRYRASDMGAR